MSSGKPLVEGLVLKSKRPHVRRAHWEAPRGGAGIEISPLQTALKITCEAPRGGAGIEI